MYILISKRMRSGTTQICLPACANKKVLLEMIF
jgi:hypothetical protein